MIKSVRRRSDGFTLVEIGVVVVVIAIVATLTAMGVARFHTQSVDEKRATNATIISEALEKYYDSNGEYPICSSLTGSPQVVSNNVLTGISVDALKAPNGNANSIECRDIESDSQDDYFSYICDESPDGNACSNYELKYLEESSGQVLTETSRRHAVYPPDSAINTAPNASATAIGVDEIRVTWTSVANATEYAVEYATSSSFNNSDQTSSNSSPAVIGGLTPETTYYFRVAGVHDASQTQGPWSSSVSAKTDPLEIGSLSTSVNSTTSITASWQAVDGASSYRLQYSGASNFSSPTTINNITTTNRQVTSLTPGVRYYFRVLAVVGGVTSDWSNTSISTTGMSIPSGHGTSTTSNTAITQSWNSVAGATGYYVQRASNSTFTSGLSSTTVTGTSRSWTGLNAGQTYYFRVRANGANVNSGYSSTSTRTTSISTPSGHSSSATSNTAVSHKWNAVAGASSYYVQRATNSGFTSGVSSATVTGTSRSWTGLKAGQTYYLRVRANGANTNSSYASTSQRTNITTPGGHSTSTTSSSAISQKWNAVSGVSSYYAQRATNSAFTSGVSSATVTGTSRSWTGLNAGQTYYFRVRANGANANSGYTSTSTRTTSISAPATPSASAAYTSSTRAWNASNWVQTNTGSPNSSIPNWYYVRLSLSGSSCASGSTRQFQARVRLSASGGYGPWSSWSTASTLYGIRHISSGSSSGVKFESRARCVGNNSTSGASGIRAACAWYTHSGTSCTGR